MCSVPGHPDVQVTARLPEGGEIYITYYGSAEALIGAGVATTEMLALYGRSGKRPQRLDPLGRHYTFSHWWVGVADGKPTRRFRIGRRGPIELMPGAREAIAELERMKAERAATYVSGPREPSQKPPHLRLVVDNTRDTVH